MRVLIATALAFGSLALPALAEGDAAAGEKVFRQCQACHVVVNDAGETLAGTKAKVGPNLYGVAGRTAGTVEDFKYSDFMVAAGEAGLVWNEEDFLKYVNDPTPFLKDYTGDSKARGKMTFKLKKEDQARDVWAFLVSLAPES